MSSKSVIVIGGGLAGLSSAVALAEAGFRVRLLEQRPFLGGRASSYTLPGGEHVDNCQHVTLGCCTNLSDFYRRAGAESLIKFYDELTFVDREGRRSTMKASPLPAPIHLAHSLALYSSVAWNGRQRIGRAMLAIARRGGCNSGGDAEGASMLDWLRLHGQTEEAIERFWSVVLVSALDETLARTDARYGLDVFWKAFLSNRAGYLIGIPTVPLGTLYGGCRAAVESRGGEVVLRAPVRALRLRDNRVAAIETADGREETADLYVAAVPHDALLDLLPPSLIEREPSFSNLRRLRVSPITGVHFWFDREIMSEPFLTLVDRTAQWIFNKSRLGAGHFLSRASASSSAASSAPSSGPSYRDGGQYLQLVISASYDLLPRTRQEIVDLCLRELREVLPETRAANLLKATVIKEPAATFSPEPGADRWRPAQRTKLPNLFLAGDWTATGWPATMEGAVRSGYMAAEEILAVEGVPRRLVKPDLPVETLARRFAADSKAC
jgi:squalene-associated FAD-dependent desaturase